MRHLATAALFAAMMVPAWAFAHFSHDRWEDRHQFTSVEDCVIHYRETRPTSGPMAMTAEEFDRIWGTFYWMSCASWMLKPDPMADGRSS